MRHGRATAVRLRFSSATVTRGLTAHGSPEKNSVSAARRRITSPHRIVAVSGSFRASRYRQLFPQNRNGRLRQSGFAAAARSNSPSRRTVQTRFEGLGTWSGRRWVIRGKPGTTRHGSATKRTPSCSQFGQGSLPTSSSSTTVTLTDRVARKMLWPKLNRSNA